MIKRGFIFGIIILVILSFVFAATVGDTDSSVSVAGLRIFADTFNGTTTDFISLGTLELNNLSNMTLERTGYGKVVFNSIVNLTQVKNASYIVDFDSHLNISNNLVYIDNSYLPNLNKSVTITLVGLTFTTPQIIKGATVCVGCSLVSYSGGTLIFTSSYFEGAYYVRETPIVSPVCGNNVCESGETSTSCPADCSAPTEGGGGGGGGGGTTTDENGTIIPAGMYDFNVSEDFFIIPIGKGTYFQKNLILVNNGTRSLTINIFVAGLSDYIFPQERLINLSVGESKTVRFDIYVSSSVPSDVYTGKIYFRNSYVSRESEVVLDIQDRFALFDIRTTMLKKYVSPGGRAMANVSIINMGDLRNFDVKLNYKILDFDNNSYTLKEEDFAINQTHTGVYFLDVPKDLPMGNYLFYTRVSAGDVGASSFDTFTVEKVSFWVWILIIIIIIILIIIILTKFKRDEEEKKPVEKKPLLIPQKEFKVKVPKLP